MITDAERIVAILRGTLFRDTVPFIGQRVLYVGRRLKLYTAGIVRHVEPFYFHVEWEGGNVSVYTYMIKDCDDFLVVDLAPEIRDDLTD